MSEVNDVESTEAPLPPPATAPVLDANGIPIVPGDVVRAFSHVGKRRRKYYRYAVVVRDSCGALRAIPAGWLEMTEGTPGGAPALTDGSGWEIVAGSPSSENFHERAAS
jgi:hypothetical protein